MRIYASHDHCTELRGAPARARARAAVWPISSTMADVLGLSCHATRNSSSPGIRSLDAHEDPAARPCSTPAPPPHRTTAFPVPSRDPREPGRGRVDTHTHAYILRSMHMHETSALAIARCIYILLYHNFTVARRTSDSVPARARATAHAPGTHCNCATSRTRRYCGRRYYTAPVPSHENISIVIRSRPQLYTEA